MLENFSVYAFAHFLHVVSKHGVSGVNTGNVGNALNTTPSTATTCTVIYRLRCSEMKSMTHYCISNLKKTANSIFRTFQVNFVRFSNVTPLQSSTSRTRFNATPTFIVKCIHKHSHYKIESKSPLA